MKKNPDSDRLLDEILAEAAPPDFRAGLLDRTLKEVRRRQQLRRWNRGILAAALVSAAGLVAWNLRGPASRAKGPPPPVFLSVVESRPLDPLMLVQTAAASVNWVASAPATVALVATNPGAGDFRELSDDQLLAMTAGKPSILVRHGPHDAELLLVDSSANIISPADGLQQ